MDPRRNKRSAAAAIISWQLYIYNESYTFNANFTFSRCAVFSTTREKHCQSWRRPMLMRSKSELKQFRLISCPHWIPSTLAFSLSPKRRIPCSILLASFHVSLPQRRPPRLFHLHISFVLLFGYESHLPLAFINPSFFANICTHDLCKWQWAAIVILKTCPQIWDGCFILIVDGAVSEMIFETDPWRHLVF